MTDTKPEKPKDEAAVLLSTGKGDRKGDRKQDGATGQSSKSPSAHPAKGHRQIAWPLAFFVIVLLLIGLAGAVWYVHNTIIQEQSRIQSVASQSGEAAAKALDQAGQAIRQSRQLETQVDRLTSALESSQAQLADLEKALQLLSEKGSDLVLLNELDHLITVAHQQLLLGGNVANAIIALETAQARLAKAGRPHLASLQQAINGDLDRLRAAATVDIPVLSEQLDELQGLVASAPLLVPDDANSGSSGAQPDTEVQRAADSTASSRPTDETTLAKWWNIDLNRIGQWSSEAWASVRHELSRLVSVRRVDDVQALLLSPEQARNLRDNLRLRLITARLALLMHQPEIWVSEIQGVLTVLDTRFDKNSREVRRAIRLADSLLEAPINRQLPTVENSMQALAALQKEDTGQSLKVLPENDVPSDVSNDANALHGHRYSLAQASASSIQSPASPEARKMLDDLHQDEALIRSDNRAAESSSTQPGPEARKMLDDLRQDEALIRSDNRAAESSSTQPGPEARKMLDDLRQDEALIRSDNRAADSSSTQPGPEARKMLDDLRQDEALIRSDNRAAESSSTQPGPEARKMLDDLRQDERLVEQENTVTKTEKSVGSMQE